ncbi:MAG: metal-dependent hydrolase [Deltaproteobacteria bacterium]|jgi:inner membrane protein|nr:metal-dependent hydrolase [Deltaproteobacteria bacterium]MBW2534529.1 metal-dependent hydrolase [Deltaproteobacteria bacterium]
MDTFTQAALGAAVGQAGFSRKLGRHAVWVGALLGALPDFDIVSRAFGPWAGIVHHRGATHSLLFAPLVAPLLGYVLWRLLDVRRAKRDGREPDRGRMPRWMHLSFWALITHPLLDWCTSYGTQLGWPLTDARFAIDAIMIVDPIYTLTLAAALLVGWIYRQRLRVGQLAGVAALVLTTGYLAFGYHQSQLAKRIATEQLRAVSFEPVHVRAQPSLLLWMWRVVARDERGDLRVGALSTYKPTWIDFDEVNRPEHPLVSRALQSDRGRIFSWFADGFVGVRVEEQGSRTRVVLEDQRYGLVTQPTEAFWGAVAEFDDQGELVSVDRFSNHARGEMKEALRVTWDMMWNGATVGRQAAASASALEAPEAHAVSSHRPAASL